MPRAARYGLAVLDLGNRAVERDVEPYGRTDTDVGAGGSALRGRCQHDVLGAVLGAQIDVAATERDDRGRGIGRAVTDDGAGVGAGNVDGHRTSHPGLAAAGARDRFGMETLGLVDQLLVVVAIAGQMDQLAGGCVFACCGQANLMPGHHHHVVGAQIAEAGDGGAATGVGDRVAGVQVGGVSHFQESCVTGGVEADVGRERAQVQRVGHIDRVLELVAAAGADTGQVLAAGVAAQQGGALGAVQADLAAVLDAHIVGGGLVQSADA